MLDKKRDKDLSKMGGYVFLLGVKGNTVQLKNENQQE